MGRGLSQLQQAILALAYRKRRERSAKVAETEPGSHDHAVLTQGVGSVDLYFPEILHELYGFEVRSVWWDPERGERPTWGQNFNRRAIGERRYHSAQAAISRAVSRLEARGMVVYHRRPRHFMASPACLDLTEKGLEAAEMRR
jgi:hypothetical protein